ncbi:MAG: EthD domain-containing protein [Steroidobacteraceae bacterium]|nr:EthD domain-containing protein [Steroidobacteraceae bacterium]MBP7012643.1 EthD domain-containing protein [Steroidobacteraceae bacterium]
MEKLLYAFWRGDAPADRLRDRFLGEVAPRLRDLGADRLQFNISDFPDMTGTLPNFRVASLQPRPDGIISFWLTSAWRRDPLERVLREPFARIAGYAVAESTILRNVEHRVPAGERTPGFSQVTFLQVPPRLSATEWRRIWSEEHTSVGIDIQANFRYVQNVVTLPLAADGPPFSGVVEECFPIEAMRDPQVFFDAPGDPAECQRRAQLMQHSCAKFIDFDRLDVIATSEYMLHSGDEPAT